ncbi:MAG: ATP-binding cassette domain-containing protein [Thermoanaerobaculia bacterium]|nr:ATP-binding cassette domain-containing protein [Thermoanaerobaculia bacterium]
MPDGYSLGATLLKVEGVSLALGGKQILRDVNLEIKDIVRPGKVTGQVVSLLAPSGMGKTQLFRILAGLNKPDSGKVLIGEKGKPVERGMVGVVAQNYPLFAHRRVLGNLVVAAVRNGLSKGQAVAKSMEFLGRFKLEDAAQKFPAQLSGGQRQRVAIAQQFLCSEHFLLMDEPFSGLDVVQVENVIELIGEMADISDFNTIIVVTHDITAAIEVADTIWLMGRDRDKDGRIVPGARIVATYDLIERGLAWRKDIVSTPEFQKVRQEIRERFPLL